MQDLISGDELFSDAFPIKLIDDIVYEVDCAMVQQRKGVDVDIGANASAEGGEEELEDGVETVNNVVASFQLQSTSFDKKTYLTYLKGKQYISIKTMRFIYSNICCINQVT